jgi:hypothetical protein
MYTSEAIYPANLGCYQTGRRIILKWDFKIRFEVVDYNKVVQDGGQW